MGQRGYILVAILASILCLVVSHPVATPTQADGNKLSKAEYVEKLETDLMQAAAVGGIAEAIRVQQKFEEQILHTAVKTLVRDRTDPEKQARDMQALNALVRRDKRAVELLTGVLGSSGGSTGGDNASGDASSGGSNALSLVTGVLGSSSGGSGDSEDGGGGSNLLSLIPSLLGSSSGGGGDSEDGGGGSNLLSLIPSLFGSSSGGGSGDAGGEGGGGGGGSNILSLLTGVLGSSSGSNSGDAQAGSSVPFKPLGGIFDQKLNLLNVGGGDDVLKGGTYDDLIGKSGGGDLIGTITNTVSSVLKAKFNVFKSLFSSLTGNLLGGSGGATT